MENRINIFEENPMVGGYSLAVRDDWVYTIKRVNISDDEKAEYETEFGDKILTYNEFFVWWCEYNNVENTAMLD